MSDQRSKGSEQKKSSDGGGKKRSRRKRSGRRKSKGDQSKGDQSKGRKSKGGQSKGKEKTQGSTKAKEQQPKKSTRRRKRSGRGKAKAATKDTGSQKGKESQGRRSRKGRGGSSRPQTEQAPKTMLVNIGDDRHQISVLEEGTLIEHYVAHVDSESVVGNIYMGKVQNVLPGMEAAFVDIGIEKNAVLYSKEVGYDEEVEGADPPIEAVLRSGQSILVQVTKDPMGSKGARLTMQVSLPGRYVVLLPDSDFLGISRQLPDNERSRLKGVADRVKPPDFGLIVRTAAEGVGEDELDRDVASLVKTWYDVYGKRKKVKAPKLVYREPKMVIRVVRDLFTRAVEKLVVDDPDVYKSLKGYVSEVTPDLEKRIELHEDKLPLFEKFHVIEQIYKAIDRKVWLPSGGHIVVDRTEAMTVIDVNTGKFVGKSKLEDTVLKTNLEAADEIAKQLRLRDIGGIIVIDFIDLMEEKNRNELLRAFRDALTSDKTRTQVFGVSELGIVQMTRKRVSEGLLEAFSEQCEVCSGRGRVIQGLD